MPSLFSPITLGNIEYKNRVFVAPMCQYSAVNGVAQEWHHAHIGAMATGGYGLIIMEATGVVPEGRISVDCLGIWNEEQAQALKPIVEFAHTQGTKIGIQLAHAGRKGSTTGLNAYHPIATVEEGGWQTVAPSPIGFHGMPTPRPLTIAEIGDLVKAWGEAAQRAVNAGFDAVEIHAAHGYLLHQFLSPLTNERADEYGGIFVNRIRFLCEVATEVRKVIGIHKTLLVRISATDWVEGGWNIEESIELARELKNMGVDLIHVSTGGIVYDAKIPVAPNFQVNFATRIRNEAMIPTCAVGLITESQQANRIIENEEADAVAIGREVLRNPRWALAAASELGQEVQWPIQYVRAKKS